MANTQPLLMPMRVNCRKVLSAARAVEGADDQPERGERADDDRDRQVAVGPRPVERA